MNLTKEILNLRPKRIQKKIGEMPVLLLDLHTVFQVLNKYPLVIMAANPRIKQVIPGLMKAAQEMDSVIIFQLAASECNLKDGYTGLTPKSFFETIINYALKNKFTKPFVIHTDHVKIKDTKPETIQVARDLISEVINVGYTSVAIDASSNQLDDNIRITAELAKPVIENGLGLEVEIGEVLSKLDINKITTVEEAENFVKSLIDLGIQPDILAIYNGAKHGNYLPNEKVYIDLKRTKEIYQAIKKYGLSIAQHGITGTPMNLVKKFADCGIRKGNVATEWQNIALKNLPTDLRQKMENWARANNKDIKFAIKQFKTEIDNIPQKFVEKIITETYKRAKEFIKVFRSKNSAKQLISELLSGHEPKKWD
ncbi:MAG: class II fructose-bisphosphate aldolase [Patescibacteria group bacterium]